MKNYASVMMLYNRGTIYQIFVRMLITIGAQCGMFMLTLRRYGEAISAGAMGLEKMIDKSSMDLIFLLSLVLAVLSPLSDMGVEKNSKVGYTLRRLAITERQTVLVQWGYNTLVYLMFWLLHALVAVGLCLWFLNVAPMGSFNHQTLVMAFYRNDFLHNLLPLTDWFRWLRNIVLFVTFGLMTARFTYLQRRGKRAVGGTVFLIWLLWLNFISDSGREFQYEIAIMILCAVVMFFSLANLKLGDDEDEQEVKQPQV